MKYFHTQEKRGNRLTFAIKCIDEKAWLGDAFYFWAEENDAILWGTSHKKKTGFYEIYVAVINEENVLDTVFNEEHYRMWKRIIDKAAKTITKKTGAKATIKELNEYFKKNPKWGIVDGIKFQDLPESEHYNLVESFWYTKRIQMAVYNELIVTEFNYLSNGRC